MFNIGISNIIRVLIIFLIISIAVIFLMFGDPQMLPGDKVAVIEIAGSIYGSQSVVELLHRYRSDDSVKAIVLRINSPGGVVTSGMAVYDTMQYIKPDIATVCIGQAASMGALLLAAGKAGKRYSLPNSRILIHQPMGGFQGQASDIEIQAQEILRMKANLNKILAKHTGRDLVQIQADTDRDYFMSAEDVKWRKPVLPGDTLAIEVQLTKVRAKIGKAKGVCKVRGEVVSEAEVTFMLRDL